MFRKCIEKLLIFTIGAIIGTVADWYVPVLVCDVWRLECVICQ